jgi:hypothetical protein
LTQYRTTQMTKIPKARSSRERLQLIIAFLVVYLIVFDRPS